MVHESMRDVYVEVLQSRRRPDHMRMQVKWWNLGFTGKPWLVPLRGPFQYQWIEISDREWLKWREFNPNRPDTHPGRGSL